MNVGHLQLVPPPEPPAPTPEETRQRARELIAGTRAALLVYREAFTQSAQRTLDRLEAMEAWTNGGELPAFAIDYATVNGLIDAPQSGGNERCAAGDRHMHDHGVVTGIEESLAEVIVTAMNGGSIWIAAAEIVEDAIGRSAIDSPKVRAAVYAAAKAAMMRATKRIKHTRGAR